VNFFRREATQRLPIPLDEAWRFFADPRNLASITPPTLGLTVCTGAATPTHAGMILTYRVRPILGFPVDWVTEITHVEDRVRFVDEQRFGPFRFWHHLHEFQGVPGGVEVRDLVHYKLPVGPFSPLVDVWVVRRQLDAIFAYRARALAQRFGTLD